MTITIEDVNEPPVISFSAHANVARDGNALSLNEDYRDRIAAFRASDPERAPGLTYQWSVVGTDAGDFAVTTATDTRSAQLSFAASLDYDRPADSNSDNTYSITVQATDIPMEDTENGTPRPLTSRIALTVTVTLVPTTARPIIRGDAEPSIEEGVATLVGTYTATGRRRDDFIVWQPLEAVDADQFTFTSTGPTGRLALRATPNYESPTDFQKNNIYDVRLAARVGNEVVRRVLVVEITNKDEAGEIRISSLQPVVNVDLTATLSDIDRVVSAVWTWESATSRSGPWTALTGATGSVTESTYTPAEADLNQYLRVTATYTDGHGMGKTLSDTLEQRVAPETVVGDHQPQFIERLQQRSVLESAGPNAPVGAPVTATDSDGDDLTYTLRNDRGYFTIDAHGSTAGQIRVAPGATLDHETDREVVVIVDAADLATASDTSHVTITIEDVNEAPHGVSDLVFSPEDEPVTIRVLENDTDPDDDELTVTIVRQPANGTLTVDNPANPGDRPTVTYTPREENFNGADSFTYKAQDTGNLLSVETTVAVIVEAVNDLPTFVESMPTRLVSESAQAGDAVGAPVTATDIEGQPTTYSLSGEDASKFRIHVGSGQITVAGGVTFDIDMEDTYTVTVTATDTRRAGIGALPLMATVEVTISVTTNAAPTFPSTLFADGQTGLSVRENAGAGTVVGLAPEATDPESGTLSYSLAVDGFTTDPPFEIGPSSRQIRVVRGAVLDHEDQDTYSVTVTAEDEVTLTRAATFDITIDDVNEPPVAVADSAVTTQEDTAVTFGALVNDPDVGDTLTVTITTQPRRGRVVVDTNTQMLTYTPADNDHGTYTFTYTARDDGRLTTLPTQVTITVSPVNDPPEFDATSTERSVPEDATGDALVGAPVTATDSDPGDTLTYSLSGADATSFVVDSNGQITVATGVTIGMQPTYTVTVTATDSATPPLTATVEVTITVTDDPQVTVSFGASTYTVAEGDTVEVTVTLSADPERQVVIPLTHTPRGEAGPTDYSVPGSVTFDTGDTSKTITFTATQDAIDDDGESVLLGFGTSLPAGVSVGTTVTTTVSIDDDDDDAGVSVSEAALTIGEGSSGTYTIVLRSQPTADVTVTINDPSGNTGVTADPASLTFSSSDWSSTKTVTVNAAQDADAEDETATVSHTVTSTDSSYSSATANSVVVTVTDDDDVPVTVSFGLAAYSADEGDTVMVTVMLSADP